MVDVPVPNSLAENFIITEQHDDIGVKGNIVCTCKNDIFSIKYKGEQRKFFQPLLKPYKDDTGKHLYVELACIACGQKIVLYDSDAYGLKQQEKIQLSNAFSPVDLVTKKALDNRWKMESVFNSWGKDKTEELAPGYPWNDLFISIYIYGKNACSGKNIAIIEEELVLLKNTSNST